MARPPKGEITMTCELLNIFGMNTMMAEDANEPSLRIRPRHRVCRNRNAVITDETNEAFLRMLTAR